MKRPAFLLAPLFLALTFACSGCLTFVTSNQGTDIDAAAVKSIRRDHTTLPQVLAALGAPLEVHAHADGRLLVYRHRLRHTFRLNISPSQALSLVDLSQAASEAAKNASLTITRVNAGEDRVVVLIDHEGIVRSVGYKQSTQGLPIF